MLCNMSFEWNDPNLTVARGRVAERAGRRRWPDLEPKRSDPSDGAGDNRRRRR
jgi:hypothetical protein